MRYFVAGTTPEERSIVVAACQSRNSSRQVPEAEGGALAERAVV